MIDLNSKVALITGGSRGIGKACVEIFAKAGADVAFTFNKREDRAKELISRLNHLERKISSYKCSLESEDEIISTVKKVFDEFGKIDILINNAGIWEYGEADTMTLENWNRTMSINVTGTMLFTREVIPSMSRIKKG